MIMETPPPIPPQSPGYAAPGAPGPIDLGRCFNDALEVFKKNALVLILAAVLFGILSVFSLFILCGPLSGGIVLMCLAALAKPDKKVDIGLMFATFPRFGPQVGLFFLTAIPTWLGLALLIVPGVALMAMWMFAFPLMVDKGMGITESMSASWHIVRRRGFGWNLLLAAIIFAMAIAPGAIPHLGFFLGLLLGPITWLLLTSAYIQQVREREDDLADILSPRGFPVE